MNLESEILIVGAGICGLMAAHRAAAAGRQVIVVDKGDSVGGRLATRRIGSGRADLGAQFFTVRSPAFQTFIDRWLAQGLVYVWSTGWSDGSLAMTPSDGYPRYAVHGGMNALAKALAAEVEAAGANIHVETKLISVLHTGASWVAHDDSGNEFRAGTLVLTPPVPHSLALLDAGNVVLTAGDHVALAAIEYAPCLCGLFHMDGEVDLPAPGALQRPKADMAWIADNQRKGISPEAKVVTVHAGPDFSRAHYADQEHAILATMQRALQPYLHAGATTTEAQLKRWRYSLPTVLHPDRFLHAAELPPLYFGGDAFGHPRVEGAALSGMAIGDALVGN